MEEVDHNQPSSQPRAQESVGDRRPTALGASKQTLDHDPKQSNIASGTQDPRAAEASQSDPAGQRCDDGEEKEEEILVLEGIGPDGECGGQFEISRTDWLTIARIVAASDRVDAKTLARMFDPHLGHEFGLNVVEDIDIPLLLILEWFDRLSSQKIFVSPSVVKVEDDWEHLDQTTSFLDLQWGWNDSGIHDRTLWRFRHFLVDSGGFKVAGFAPQLQQQSEAPRLPSLDLDDDDFDFDDDEGGLTSTCPHPSQISIGEAPAEADSDRQATSVILRGSEETCRHLELPRRVWIGIVLLLYSAEGLLDHEIHTLIAGGTVSLERSETYGGWLRGLLERFPATQVLCPLGRVRLGWELWDETDVDLIVAKDDEYLELMCHVDLVRNVTSFMLASGGFSIEPSSGPRDAVSEGRRC